MSSRTKLSRNAAMLVCSVALAGCVGVPVEELLASTAIVAELQRENGALVEAGPAVGTPSSFRPSRRVPSIASLRAT